MTKSREIIKIVIHPENGEEKVDERIGMVYKKRDGREWVHHMTGYRSIVREGTLAVLHINLHQVQSNTLAEVVNSTP